MGVSKRRELSVITNVTDTVKPVCNDHLYNKMRHLYFIQ